MQYSIGTVPTGFLSAKNNSKSTQNQWVILLKDELEYAVQIVSVEDVVNYPRQLVYLEN